MKKFLLGAMVLLSFTMLFAKTYLDGVYHNSRFGFAISYPKSIFTQKEYPTNGDGVWLRDKKGESELTVGAMFEIDDRNIKELFYDSLDYWKSKKGIKVTYKVQKANWFVISGYDYSKDKIFYNKEYLINSIRSGFTLTYPIENRKKLDNLTGQIAKSFKPSSKEY